MKTLDPTVRRAPYACEAAASLVTICKDRVILLPKIAEIFPEIHEPGVRKQLNRMFCFAHPEWRLECEESKRRIVEVIRLVDRQCLQQRSVARRQPAGFIKRVSLGPVLLYLTIVRDIPFCAELGEIHELVRGHGEVE